MPGWKGWNEAKVRGVEVETRATTIRQHRNGTSMAGFTAINAPSASSGVDISSRRNLSDGKKRAKTIASECLARGAEQDSAHVKQSTRPLHVPGSKKTSGAGKKRSDNTNDQSKAKRRKTSNVAEGMTANKPSSRKTKKPTTTPESIPASTPSDSISAGSEGFGHRFGGGTAQATDVAAHPVQDANPSEVSTISVVAPETTMSSLHSTSQQTSCDALKQHSSVQSATLYQSCNARADNSYPAEFAHPSAAQAEQCNSINETQGTIRALQPRKAKSAQTSVQSTEHPRAKEPLRQPKSKPSSPSSKIPLTVRDANDNEEDFLGGDDYTDDADLIEALGRVKTVQSSIESKSQKQAAPEVGPKQPAQKTVKEPTSRKRRKTVILTPEDELMQLASDDDEADRTDAAGSIEEEQEANDQRLPTPPLRDNRRNIREVDPDEDYGGAFLSDADRELLVQLKRSSVPTTTRTPIVRKPFPPPLLDRSPLFGTTNATTLRTCFRLGEALNVGAQAARNNQHVILELYGRVTASHREGRKQHFTFHDLYHDNPPHLQGVFELWDQRRLWDLDGKAFLTGLEGGKMCRVVGRMKRKGHGSGPAKWRMEVLSIWEAGWDDVDFVSGIYAKDDKAINR